MNLSLRVRRGGRSNLTIFFHVIASVGLVASFAMTTLAQEKIRFKTTDGQTLYGLYQAPRQNNPTVVMLHGLGAWKEEWTPLMTALEKEGWGYLTYDARGHGQSSLHKGADGSADGYKYFGAPVPGSPWGRMIDDIGAAIRYLTSDKKIKRGSVFLAGASLGANDALNFSVLSLPPPGLILLSPGLNYQNVETEGPIQKARFPVLIAASEGDLYAFQSAKKLANLNPKVELWTDVKPGHGVQMFDEALIKRILHWLKNKSVAK